MSEDKGADSGRQLLRLAAEAIARLVQGCSALLQLNPIAPGKTADREAINRFGPAIVARWFSWLIDMPRQAQEEAIQQLAILDSRSAVEVANSTLSQLRASGSSDDRRVALDYLSAIPTTVRGVLVPDPDSGRLVAPIRTECYDESILLRLLPVNAPPFSVGSDLTGSPYRLEQLVGSGGFGVVYKATNRFEQNTPPRAIKFCLNADMVASLHREKDLLNRLLTLSPQGQWPDRLVQLYGHNLDAAIPFLVYEYVPGGSLMSKLAAIRRQTGQNLRPAQVVGLVRRIAEAVAQAHAFGLVHRDLKPSNFLISGNMVKLADFGIGGVVSAAARTVGSASTLTVSQQCSRFRGAGTPLYMSPEQRQALAPEPNHDVYSIGVMWYQFLLGDYTRELHAGWADELVEEYDVPQRHVELISACVGYAKKRPASAQDLLALLPSPTSVQAPTPPSVQVGPAGTLAGHDGAVHSVAFFRDSRRLVTGSADGTARLWDVEAQRQLSSFLPGARSVGAVAVSPDNRWVLLGCDDGYAFLWDVVRGADPRCFSGHTRSVNSVGFAPDGRRAVTGSADGSIRLWHVGTGRELLRMEEGNRRPITGVCFTPDGLSVASCAEGGGLRLWDAETGWEAQELATGGWMLCVAVSPDGRLLACGGKDGLTLWNLETGERQDRLDGHTLPVTGVAFSLSGTHLLSGAMDRTVRLWDVANRRVVHVFDERQHLVRAVALSADGRLAASGGDDRLARVWALPRAQG